MFRSFFPTPKIFFSSAVAWLLLSVVIWFTIGEPIRAAVSVDRFTSPRICTPAELPPTPTPAADQATAATPADAANPATAPAAPAAGTQATNPNAPATTDSAAPAAATVATSANCVAQDTNFLNGAKVWLYQYVIMVALLFCVFWYFYKRNEWYWWSVVGSAAILLVLYFSVQVDAFINDWSGVFFDMVQSALSKPRSVPPDQFYGQVISLFVVLLPTVLVQVFLAFFTSHYVFRWRKAMNAYYMLYWQAIRTTEGAAQRVQEDTMRFASIVEDLGTTFFSSLITLVVFLPLLWNLSTNVTELPIFGSVPGSLVWVALVAAALGTVLLAVVGIKLPGLNFANQRVEAAYRKELVFGEEDPTRADPPTVSELFAGVQRNYFRLYFHYAYFNVARYGYLTIAGYIPLLALSPSILAGALTLGIYQQVQIAFDQVSSSFQFFARAWTTIVELQSIHSRLRLFESFIPRDQEPVKEVLPA